MNIKDTIKNIFYYTPQNTYNFDLPNNKDIGTNLTPQNELDNIKNIFYNLNMNLNLIKSKYNTLINSDIVIRKFTLNACGKEYSAFLLYIDGMVDSEIMNDFILKPLMLKNQNNLFDASSKKIVKEYFSNNIKIKKIKKFNLSEYISNCLIPQNNVKIENEFSSIFSAINSGNCALFVDTLNIAYNVDLKGFKQRSVDTPINEVVIKGPHEAFVENIRTNTALVRRIINNENLIIENTEVGKITKTKCAVCYMQNITNPDLVNEVLYRINNLKIDSLLSAGELEQLISDSNILGIPEMITTERPDKVTKYLLAGRVVIIVNGSPYGIIVPVTTVDFLTSSEDTNLRANFGNFLRVLRVLSAFITLLLPGFYIAITSYHQEILPTSLLFSILAARENVPFPIIFELLLMEFSFELVREAGLRVPSPIGPTIRNSWSFNTWAICSICKYCKSHFNNSSCYYRNSFICNS